MTESRSWVSANPSLVVALSVIWCGLAVVALSRVTELWATLVASCLIGVLPIAVLAGYEIGGHLSPDNYRAEVVRFFPGAVLYAFIAPIRPDDAGFPHIPLVLALAGLYLALAGRAARPRDVDRRLLIPTILGSAAVGTLADLPSPPGWGFLAFAWFGACYYVSIVSTLRRGVRL